LLALSILGVAAVPGTAAEIKGYAVHCKEEKKICFWHKAMVTPPRGWVEDDGWTERYQAMVLFENGDQSSDKPMMYLRAHGGDKQLALDTYVQVAQGRWKNQVPDTTIEPLADFERKDKPSFKVSLYKNPSVPEQAFELTAFTKDVDAAHPDQTYFFQAVLVSPSMEELERAKPAFYELLGKL
jgi:hypothetical protein